MITKGLSTSSVSDALNGIPQPLVAHVVNGLLHVAWSIDHTGISGGACDPTWRGAVDRAMGEYAEHYSQVHAVDMLAVLPSPGDRPLIDSQSLGSTTAGALGSWLVGQTLRSMAEVAVPAQAVFLGWDPPPPERRLWAQTSAGTAAARDHAQARVAALAEVIERHILIDGWSTGDIEFEDLSRLHDDTLPTGLSQAFDKYGVTLRTLRVIGLVPDLVVALLYRGDGDALTCGAALRGDTADAIVHAACEAVAVRLALSSSSRHSGLQGRDQVRGLAVATAGREHVRFVSERIRAWGKRHRNQLDLDLLLDTAQAIFSHEPVAVELPAIDRYRVHRIVCPGSAVFEPLAGTPSLTCPIA
jgi:YcaO cyclodehydratase, ATP-ad Mg2+-binding